MSSTPVIASPVAAPWWRFAYVWLLLAGPAVVIVAGFVTLWLALAWPDPVVGPEHQHPGLAPALQARNHAATPEHRRPR